MQQSSVLEEVPEKVAVEPEAVRPVVPAQDLVLLGHQEVFPGQDEGNVEAPRHVIGPNAHGLPPLLRHRLQLLVQRLVRVLGALDGQRPALKLSQPHPRTDFRKQRGGLDQVLRRHELDPPCPVEDAVDVHQGESAARLFQGLLEKIGELLRELLVKHTSRCGLRDHARDSQRQQELLDPLVLVVRVVRALGVLPQSFLQLGRQVDHLPGLVHQCSEVLERAVDALVRPQVVLPLLPHEAADPRGARPNLGRRRRAPLPLRRQSVGLANGQPCFPHRRPLPLLARQRQREVLLHCVVRTRRSPKRDGHLVELLRLCFLGASGPALRRPPYRQNDPRRFLEEGVHPPVALDARKGQAAVPRRSARRCLVI
mmetsp:Transcript_2006/g.6729  ORF Transcript_2006/g.6729 Transcript_2006/m.6729 type:complete len:369 (+) Transcript_2006:67-1173(+)